MGDREGRVSKWPRSMTPGNFARKRGGDRLGLFAGGPKVPGASGNPQTPEPDIEPAHEAPKNRIPDSPVWVPEDKARKERQVEGRKNGSGNGANPK